jgi:hypothetical protein
MNQTKLYNAIRVKQGEVPDNREAIRMLAEAVVELASEVQIFVLDRLNGHRVASAVEHERQALHPVP